MSLTPPPGFDSDTQEMSRPRDTFIGPYKVEVKIGDGGMGSVYKCYDSKLKRFVAIKVLKEKYAVEESSRNRFHREAQSIASVSHANVAQIHAIEDGNGSPPFLVMEYVEGSSVETLLKGSQTLPLARAVEIMRETAFGLKAAHLKGIVHRDVKPSNLLIGLDGAVKIVDFGLAKVVEGGSSLTEEGMVVGTPHYISPEQGRGQKVDHRSDIYSLGATFYHLVVGRPPFAGDSQLAVIVAHLNEVPEPPHRIRPEIPESVSLVIGKMMAKDPESRYGTYEELIEDLDRLSRGENVGSGTARIGNRTYRKERRRLPAPAWAALGAALAIAAVGALLLLASPRPGEAELFRKLGSSYIQLEGEKEGLDILFAGIPEKYNRTELVHDMFVFLRQEEAGAARARPAGQPEISIDYPGPSLRLKDLTAPAAFRFPFRRVDGIRLDGVRLEGHVDFGIAIVHPDGARLRSLLFSIQGGPAGTRTATGPAGGSPGEAAGVCPSPPIVARRNGDVIPLSTPAGAIPLLGTGPYGIEVGLRPEGDATRITFRVAKGGAGGGSVFETPKEGLLVPGSDWTSGVLLFWSPSPVGRGSVAIGRMVLEGLLDHEGEVEGMPVDPL
jgi:predicted Ser/Thr protein kinase